MDEQNSWALVPQHVRARLRKIVFDRDRHECQIRGPECTGVAEDLDHIVPRHEDPTRILDVTNMRASCRKCNRGRQRPKTAPPSRSW